MPFALLLVWGCQAPADPQDPPAIRRTDGGPTMKPVAIDSGGKRVAFDSGGPAEPPLIERPPAPQLPQDGGVTITSAPPTVNESVPPLTVSVIMIDIAGQEIPGRGKPKVPGLLKIASIPKGTTPADLATSVVTQESPAAFAIHGNSSAGAYPMKSIEFEFRDATGMDRDLSILGLPAGGDFNLYACYADKTALRNYLAFEIARQMGHWAPRTRFVELFIDGKYQGLYLLEERIRRDKYRVPIPKPAADTTMDISGGYILKFDSDKGSGSQWRSKLGSTWNHYYPKPAEINAAQKTYIRGFIDKFEAAFASPDWANPNGGYSALTDLPSWIDTALLQELTNNPDAYWRSTYFYKDSDTRGGKLSLGPPWDYDLAFANSGLRESYKPEGLAIDLQSVLAVKDGFPFAFFWKKLWSDPAFQTSVRCRWQELRKDVLAVPVLNAVIDNAVAAISDAEKRHHLRWPVIGKSVPPNRFVGKTYQEEVNYLKDWIGKRVAWMDISLPGQCNRVPQGTNP